jgi:NADPH:quinone reductase-like Zn-dependent oxidoreductase
VKRFVVSLLDDARSEPVLRDDLPAPSPAVGEVLVRVHPSSVNPVDIAIAAGMVKDMVPPTSPSRSAATSPALSSRWGSR